MVVVPSQMRRLNQRVLLTQLLRLGVASRADLAKSLGMRQPTAGKIVDELLAWGVLEEISAQVALQDAPKETTAVANGRLGRPGRLLRLDRARPRFLGIQLEISETSLAVLPVGADREEQWSIHVPTLNSAEDWVWQLRNAAAKIRQKEFWGVLVSVPGIVDEQAGRVVFSPNLHWTEQVDLPKLIQQVWNAPVLLVQEERALALGHQAADPSGEDFLLVDFGQGVGGALVVDGKLYAKPMPISGELGHTPVLGNLRPCGCGAIGCVETLISTRGLLQSFAVAHPQGPHTWAALVDYIDDKGVVPWLAEALDATAVIIDGALNVLGLCRVIITGSITELPGTVIDHLTAAVLRGAMWGRFGKVVCQTAPRRRVAGLVAVGIDRLVNASAAHETA